MTQWMCLVFVYLGCRSFNSHFNIFYVFFFFFFFCRLEKVFNLSKENLLSKKTDSSSGNVTNCHWGPEWMVWRTFSVHSSVFTSIT